MNGKTGRKGPYSLLRSRAPQSIIRRRNTQELPIWMIGMYLTYSIFVLYRRISGGKYKIPRQRYLPFNSGMKSQFFVLKGNTALKMHFYMISLCKNLSNFGRYLMVRIAVCDDEQSELIALSALLDNYKNLHTDELSYSAFQNSFDLPEYIRDGNFDLLLLDVLMPGLNGIEAARQIRSFDSNVKIIFLTSSRDFAVESYGVGAFYYALKPVTENTLFPLLDRVLFELRLRDEDSFVIRAKAGISKILFSHLETVEVMGKNVFLRLLDGQVLEAHGPLSDLERILLARSDFIKTHRAFIVNIRRVRTLDTREALTRSGRTVPVSKSMYTEVRRAYLDHLFTEKG
jgi:DNA-binding LytR/AlgR family response regulator